MTWPVAQRATEQIAKLEEPPPAGSTEVKTNLACGGVSSGRCTRASTWGSGKARVVVSAEIPICQAKNKSMWMQSSFAFEFEPRPSKPIRA